MRYTFLKNRACYLLFFGSTLLTASCTVTKQSQVNQLSPIASKAQEVIFADNNFTPAHIGISIFDATNNRFVYNYQSDKYFIPASNTKIFTCYAAMKHLKDSLTALRYEVKNDSSVWIEPAGDPSFLHPDFEEQPAFDFLKKFKSIHIIHPQQAVKPLGRGWAWDDYKEAYMAQKSSFPIYGNVVQFKLSKTKNIYAFPKVADIIVPDAEIFNNGFDVQKNWDDNTFRITKGTNKQLEIPFKPTNELVLEFLADTLHNPNGIKAEYDKQGKLKYALFSQATDSLLKIMMHRSDNFFAEQCLLMTSNEKLGYMNDAIMIDTLLNTDFSEMPQKPKWVDGSGLSRYNLITPQDFVWVLHKMKNEFSWNRITTIFPTGNEGTLSGLYKNYSGKIFAKTGTLSNHVTLSGYLLTQSGKTFIFSVLVNAHQTTAANIRKGVEQLLSHIIETN